MSSVQSCCLLFCQQHYPPTTEDGAIAAIHNPLSSKLKPAAPRQVVQDFPALETGVWSLEAPGEEAADLLGEACLDETFTLCDASHGHPVHASLTSSRSTAVLSRSRSLKAAFSESSRICTLAHKPSRVTSARFHSCSPSRCGNRRSRQQSEHSLVPSAAEQATARYPLSAKTD